MSLTDDQKKEAIAARRGPLEHELYSAELDLKVAKKGSTPALVEGPQARVDEIKAQIKVLDDEEKKLS